MPLKLNVGLSRKVGEANYGSRGASINLEMELDSALVTEPGKLQERIRQLFSMAKTSVDEELNAGHQHQQANGNGKQADQQNGNGSGSQNSTPRPATSLQIKAVFAIARRRHINIGQMLHERFQVGRPDDLTIRQASQLIDELKSAGDRQSA